jgi:hypothetical protein
MLDVVKRELEELSARWLAVSSTIELYGGNGEALVQASRELRGVISKIEGKVSRLSIQQYATQHGVTPDTVRRWVRAGQLPATKGADGSWSIPYGAVRRKLRLSA